MAEPPDNLERLHTAFSVALNPHAWRLLRYAADEGLARADALRVSEAGTSRTAAEDLADRLEKAGLVRRSSKKPVRYVGTAFGEAVLSFIDRQRAVTPPTVQPTIIVVDGEERQRLEEAGLGLDDALRHATLSIARVVPMHENGPSVH